MGGVPAFAVAAIATPSRLHMRPKVFDFMIEIPKLSATPRVNNIVNETQCRK